MTNAERAFMKSLDFAKLIKANSLEAFALKGLAEMNKNKHQNQKALELLMRAQNLSKDIGDLTLNEGIYKEMSDNYLAMGDRHLYQYYNGKFFEASSKREQNELSSINHAIDIHNKGMRQKSKTVTDNYNILIAILIAAGLLIMFFLLHITLNIRKKNKRYQEEIQRLIRS